MPRDFEERREVYYGELGVLLAAERFVEGLREEMRAGLQELDTGLPKNPCVTISGNGGSRISVSQLAKRPAPPNLGHLRSDVASRWPMTGLLDILKEADLRVGFTELFTGTVTRSVLDSETLRKRLLLVLFGLGTNAGLKRMAASDPDASHDDLRYVKRRYVTREHMGAAIASLANGVFRARRPDVWGEGTIACASDSKKFGAWDQART